MFAQKSRNGDRESSSPLYLLRCMKRTFSVPRRRASDWNTQCHSPQSKNQQTPAYAGEHLGGNGRRKPTAKRLLGRGDDIWQLQTAHGNFKIKIASKLLNMWDGRLWKISTAQHQIALISDNAGPVYSSRHEGRPKTQEFTARETEKSFKQNVIEPARTKWASPIVFVPNKDC